MKLSLKVLSILTLIFAVNFTVTAQRNGAQRNPEQKVKKHTDRQVEKLSLDKRQADRVAQINLRHVRSVQEARKANKGDREAMKAIRKEIQTSTKLEMRSVLTQDQYIAYEELLANRKSKVKMKKRKRRK